MLDPLFKNDANDAINAYFNWNNANPNFNIIMGFSNSSSIHQPNPEYDLVKSYDIHEIKRMLCFPKQNNFGEHNYKQDGNMNCTQQSSCYRNGSNSTTTHNSNRHRPNCQNLNGNIIRNQLNLNRNLPIQRNIGNNSARGRRGKKHNTLVLDLDETLVHRKRLGFNSVSIRERPYLHYFLEKVADMFEIVVFTSSKRENSSKVLDDLDPEGRIFSKRFYRDSCTYYVNGGCVKDLSILGVDLARVAIIDNSQSMFQIMQPENGIRIKSWHDDDPDDNKLAKLLPFLETLAKADDVRPLISKKFPYQ